MTVGTVRHRSATGASGRALAGAAGGFRVPGGLITLIVLRPLITPVIGSMSGFCRGIGARGVLKGRIGLINIRRGLRQDPAGPPLRGPQLPFVEESSDDRQDSGEQDESGARAGGTGGGGGGGGKVGASCLLVVLMIARVTTDRARTDPPSHRGTGPPEDKVMGLRRPGEPPGPHMAFEPGGRRRAFARA
ncbi:hypothetical protein GCM10010446_13960 [Streptomyces enissocaesilis]|uniref:Uncharacterized protein n=1 Tax=Streptomyces enissocaesilis TaxID=332589 RepID=A0ABN3WXB0_9ACTN